MSGIYISNMEMPKEHPLYITLRPDGSVHVWDSYGGGGYGTQAIRVLEHGPLVDWNTVAGKLKETFSRLERHEETGMIYTVYRPLLDMHPIRVPVIIPADPADKEGEG